MRMLYITGFVALLISAIGCSDHPRTANAAGRDQKPVIRTAEVTRQNVSDSIDLPARVQADPVRTVHVFAPAGGQLVSVSVRPGDHVQRGQIIAVLHSNDLAQAHADYMKAKADHDRTQRALERAQLLYDHKVLPQKDYEDAKAEAISGQAELETAKEHLNLLGVPLDQVSDELQVRAPKSGVVLDVSAAPGEFSKALDASAPLCTIADLSDVWIMGDVYEKDLSSVALHKPVDISFAAYPGKTWKGRVDNISPIIDPNTRTIKVRVVLANAASQLKPDMFAQIHVQRGTRNVILLPAPAVLHDGEKTYVYVDGGGGKYQPREVKIGPMQDGSVEIASGLSGGENVVVEGAELLRPNQAD